MISDTTISFKRALKVLSNAKKISGIILRAMLMRNDELKWMGFIYYGYYAMVTKIGTLFEENVNYLLLFK